MSGRDLAGLGLAVLVLGLLVFAGIRAWDVIAGEPEPAPSTVPSATVVVTPPQTQTAVAAPEVDPTPSVDRRMKAGIDRALASARLVVPGDYELAVFLPGQPEPIVEGNRRYRMWSTSKAVVAATLLRLRAEAGEPPISEDLHPWLVSSLTRSENCAARHVMYEIQRVAGGPKAAYEAIRATTAATGAVLPETPPNAAPADAVCASVLASTEERSTPVLQMGTVNWTTRDAAQFMAGLSHGQVGGDAVGQAVIGLLSEPKKHSRELPPAELTGSPRWGAGQVFANPAWAAAYKPGWGGSQRGDYVAEQMILVRDRAGETVAIGAAFWPDRTPSTDDPGRAGVPEAFDALLDPVRRVLTR